MKLRIVLATSLAAICLTVAPTSHAAAGTIHSPLHALFSNGQKTVKFNLRNDTGTSLELKIGDKPATLKAGEVMGLKLPVGTRITTDTATDNHPAGTLIVEVSAGMYSDSTIAIKK